MFNFPTSATVMYLWEARHRYESSFPPHVLTRSGLTGLPRIQRDAPTVLVNGVNAPRCFLRASRRSQSCGTQNLRGTVRSTCCCWCSEWLCSAFCSVLVSWHFRLRIILWFVCAQTTVMARTCDWEHEARLRVDTWRMLHRKEVSSHAPSFR